ncbi:MAG: DUF3592 domain-containing protein [Pseudomonadota bacterium]
MRVFNIPYRLFILAVMLAAILGMVFWILVVNRPILEALEASGVQTQAEIVERSQPRRNWLARQTGAAGGVRVDIRYGFHTSDGEWIEDSLNKRGRYAKGLTVGRKFNVTYLPDQPEVFYSDLFKGYAGTSMASALLALCAVISLVVFYLGYRMPNDWGGPKYRPVVSFGHTEWWDKT